MTAAEFLGELDAARAKATPGEWWVDGPGQRSGEWWIYALGHKFARREDAELIVAAVNALPKLTAAVRAVEAVLDALDQTIAEAEAEGQRAVIDARVVSAQTRAVLADALAGTQ